MLNVFKNEINKLKLLTHQIKFVIILLKMCIKDMGIFLAHSKKYQNNKIQNTIHSHKNIRKKV